MVLTGINDESDPNDWYRINSPMALVSFMKNEIIISNKFDPSDEFTIVFFSCNLAKTSNSFAYNFSKQFPNATIVASTDLIYIVSRNKEIISVYTNGKWVAIKNGELQESLPDGITTDIGEKPIIKSSDTSKKEKKSDPEDEKKSADWMSHLRYLIDSGVRFINNLIP